MPEDVVKIQEIGNVIKLERDQWKGRQAWISNYPGLKEAVLKHTWTCTAGKHPYLKSSVLNVSLHRFVLDFLYGKEYIDNMLSHDNIIEHIDNNGLNCAYDNLHIISADYNKAKAFTIDKEIDNLANKEAFATDVYYSHCKGYYQMQIFFNRNIYFNRINRMPIEMFFCQYVDFRSLYIDWLYVLGCRSKGQFEIEKFHAEKIWARDRPDVVLTEEEADHVIIERDGQIFLALRPDNKDKFTILVKTVFQEIDDE